MVVLLGSWYAIQPAPRQREVERLVQNAFEREKHVSPLNVAWDLWQLYYARDGIAAPLDAGSNPLFGGVPRTSAFSHGSVRLLHNRAYEVGYSDVLQSPVWVGYRVPDVTRLQAPPRPERFEIDRRTMARVAPEEYSNSGYDRGHLAPNYAIGTRFGPVAQRETFLMSNIVPQKHPLNTGVWKELEMRIATTFPARYGEVWVLCGPIFSARPRVVGHGVAVPDAFYMIIVDQVEGRLRTLAFLIPQEAQPGSRLSAYGVSIDEIEERSGLDFLPDLEDSAEAQIEAKRTSDSW